MVNAVLVGAVMVQGGLNLKWSPKKGDTASYEVTVRGENAEGAYSAETVVVQSVVKVEKDSYWLKREAREAIVRIGGQEIRDTRANVTEVKVGLDGWVQDVKDSRSGDALRLMRAVMFVAPPTGVETGSTWKVAYVAKVATPASELSCVVGSVSGAGGKQTVKVSFSFAEKGVEKPWSGSGEWVVEVKSGLVVSTEAKLVNWLDQSGKAGTFLSKRL